VGTGLAVTLPSATGSAIISPYGTVDTVKSDFEGPCQSRLRVRARALPLDKLSGSIRKRDRALLSALRESRPSDPCWISIFPSATRSSPSRPVPPAPLELPIIFVGAVHRARLDQVDKPTRYECRSRLSPAARPAYRSFPPPLLPAAVLRGFTAGRAAAGLAMLAKKGTPSRFCDSLLRADIISARACRISTRAGAHPRESARVR
jgi:hypothetical protein